MDLNSSFLRGILMFGGIGALRRVSWERPERSPAVLTCYVSGSWPWCRHFRNAAGPLCGTFLGVDQRLSALRTKRKYIRFEIVSSQSSFPLPGQGSRQVVLYRQT